MVTDAQKRAMKRYGETTKQFVFRFRKTNDAEVIRRLEEVENKTDYVRTLIGRDIETRENEEEI